MERLLAFPGVIAVGIGPKIIAGAQSADVSIMVFTTEKKPLDAIPIEQRIPAEIDGYKTDVVQAGAPVRTAAVPLEPLRDSTKYKTLRGGLEISGGGSDDAGTLGCIAETTAGYPNGPGRIVLLTNQHVLFGDDRSDVSPHCNKSVGQTDQSCCCTWCDFFGDIVAHIRSNGVASAFVDGALAELRPGTVWRPEIQDEGPAGPLPITGVVSPDLTASAIVGGYPVWKRGMRTRKTTGSVICVNATVKNAPMSMVIQPDPTSPFPTVAVPGHPEVTLGQPVFNYYGDSGSIVLNNAGNVVGLLWGALWNPKIPNSPGFGLACAVNHVQAELKIAIKTTANTPPGDQTVPPTNDTKAKAVAQLVNPSGMHGNGFTTGARLSLDERRDALLQTKTGQEYVALALQHRTELLRLVRTNRRVATVWHRNHGPEILRGLAHLSDDRRLPQTLAGKPLDACLERIANIFARYGSPELRTDIEGRFPQIVSLARASFDEVFARLEGAHVAGQPTDEAGTLVG